MRRSRPRAGRRAVSNRAVVARLERIERQLDSDTSSPTGLRATLAAFETYWMTRFMIGLGAWLFVLTIITFIMELSDYRAAEEDRARDRESQKLARVSQAWETLLRPVGGNTGKGAALNVVLAEGAGLHGLDLSCEAVGDFRDGTCINAPILQDIDLTFLPEDILPTNSLESPLHGARFEDSRILELEAHRLVIADNFRDVSALRWKVGSMFGPLIFEEPSDIAIGNFRCLFCRVFGGEMPWSLYSAMDYAVVTGALVFVHPDETPSIPRARGRIKTTLDDPVRILRGMQGSNSSNYIDTNYPDAGSATDAILREAYAEIEFCALPADLERLELSTATRYRFARDNGAGKTSSVTSVAATALSEPSLYQCGLHLEDVEPILLDRLADWSRAKGGDMFRIGKDSTR